MENNIIISLSKEQIKAFKKVYDTRPYTKVYCINSDEKNKTITISFELK